MLLVMCASTSRSKHFIIMGVRAIGRKSFRDLTADCLGSRTIVSDLRQVRTVACTWEILNREVNTVLSSPAQCFRTRLGTTSSPKALLRLMWLRARLTPWELSNSGLGGASCRCLLHPLLIGLHF